MKTLPITLLSIAILSLAACSSTNEPAAVKARQDAMQDWRASGDIMKGMIENPDSFDNAAFSEQADLIKNSTATTWSHFHHEADKGGDSLDAVWTDAAGFNQKATEFDAAATQLSKVAKTATSAADVEAAYGELKEACGSCHKVYKKD
ncbi:cytochrome c [Moraxella nasovis]|uniref:c-type cytochrome n=1 Tax=Moraxella nasovis TaxID=2904121 RepID=UPI001F622F00|nr:cytochrome c [Moraxella nasovis]UNU72889.1 cytochrome c [Moraxella nasovis]